MAEPIYIPPHPTARTPRTRSPAGIPLNMNAPPDPSWRAANQNPYQQAPRGTPFPQNPNLHPAHQQVPFGFTGGSQQQHYGPQQLYGPGPQPNYPQYPHPGQYPQQPPPGTPYMQQSTTPWGPPPATFQPAFASPAQHGPSWVQPISYPNAVGVTPPQWATGIPSPHPAAGYFPPMQHTPYPGHQRGPSFGGGTPAIGIPPQMGYGGYGGSPHSQPSTPWGSGYGAPPPPRRGRRVHPSSTPWNKPDKWSGGLGYGEVLDPFRVKLLNVDLEINPLLGPPKDGDDAPPFLRWNMLMQTNTVSRSDQEAYDPWFDGRDNPATFPRVSELRVCCPKLPWEIIIPASIRKQGVTCSDVVEGVAAYLIKGAPNKYAQDMVEQQQKTGRMDLATAYHYIRGKEPNVPGPRIGQSWKRMDFLIKSFYWDGLVHDDETVKKVWHVASPGTVVLQCTSTPSFSLDEEVSMSGPGSGRPSPGPASRGGSRLRG